MKKSRICMFIEFGRLSIYQLIVIGLLLITNSCKKDETPAVLPVLTTADVSNINTTTANSGGNITSDGNATITIRGICWGTVTNPTIELSTKTSDGNGTGSFASTITGLTANTKYYIRAYATNSAGTAYGNEIYFTTSALVPTLSTTDAVSITKTTASIGGNILNDGGAPVTVRGICWSTVTNPTIELSTKTSDGNGTGSFASTITGLIANTKYYVRAYATNSAGTAYGNEIYFTTYNVDAISDIDNNYYNIITIGNQVWMVENLKTTKYRDGTAIPNVKDNAAWISLSTGAYCNYDNNTAHGKLYNWSAVTDAHNICPTGWHIPTDIEWTNLITYLGGESIAGGKLKETGTAHWQSPNTGATNITGFTALPSGFRDHYGEFNNIGSYGYWWSSTEGTVNYKAWIRCVIFDNSVIIRGEYFKLYGFPVRCIRD